MPVIYSGENKHYQNTSVHRALCPHAYLRRTLEEALYQGTIDSKQKPRDRGRQKERNRRNNDSLNMCIIKNK